MKADTYKSQEKKEEIVLYLCASRSPSNTKGNTKHLAQPGRETTLCGHVTIDYTQEGKIHGNKHCSYKGPDRVIGRICKTCLQKVKT